ncbi:hypothetical protein, partial [Staphylococcus aureus]|uniref:hypothetical protein n=1 Tax=Staphylococcus aureus TaxID=1280 RepID=UPI0020C0E608
MLTNGSRGTVLFAIGELHRMRSAKYKLDDRGPIDGTFELIGFEMGIGRNKGEIVKGIIEEGDPIDLGFIMQVIEGM